MSAFNIPRQTKGTMYWSHKELRVYSLSKEKLEEKQKEEDKTSVDSSGGAEAMDTN